MSIVFVRRNTTQKIVPVIVHFIIFYVQMTGKSVYILFYTQQQEE